MVVGIKGTLINVRAPLMELMTDSHQQILTFSGTFWLVSSIAVSCNARMHESANQY